MSDLATACPQCGVTAPIEDRFCEACGARLAPVADGDSEGARREIDAGTAAGLTNAGLLKPKNQDALYLEAVDGVVVAVVCDGVSSSVAADAAARVACAAAGRALSEAVPTVDPDAAMRAAAAVAQHAVRGVAWARETRLAAPSCTFVAAVWDGRQVTVGSIGDSRAYWIEGDAEQLLTADDSWVQEQVDAGLMTEPEAAGDPRAHQITRWLGADAPEGPPAITTFVPERPGRLVVCSDGLWNYASAASDFAALVRALDDAAAPLLVARSLVDHALAKGGHDNITVAVIDITPTTEGTDPVTNFSAETYQNEYLPVGGSDVNAIVRITASGSGVSSGASADAAEIIMIDVSGSMNYPRSKIRSAKEATAAAVDCIRDGVYFGVVAGTEVAREVYPGNGELVAASDATRTEAKSAIKELKAGGGTAMGQWLSCADGLFAAHPGAIHHAILLTDGQNQDESPEELDALLTQCQGHFQCDCRGVGADWEVAELREIASNLLGDVGLIREPDDMSVDFTEMMQRAMGRVVNDVALRVWTPLGTTIGFVKQVAPQIEDLTGRRTAVNDLTGEYPTGAWGDDVRDYHVRVTVPARAVGEEMLAARVSLVVDDVVLSEAKVRAIWTEDEALSTRLNPEVLRSSGDVEYAEAVQEGVAAVREGDDRTATTRLGLAWQIAEAMDDQKKRDELRPLVDVDDATGRVRPKGQIAELDLMEADLASSKTVRVQQNSDA